MIPPLQAIPVALLARIGTACGKPGEAHKFDAGAAGLADGLGFVGHYTGELANMENVEREILPRGSAALLALEQGSETREGNRLLTGEVETVELVTWAVLVVVQDARGTRSATGAPNTPGAYVQIHRVKTALNNFVPLDMDTGEPLLWHSSRVQYVGMRPLFQRPGLAYGVAVRFGTLYQVDSEAVPWATVPRQFAVDLDTIAGNLHLAGAIEPPDPFLSMELRGT